LAKYACNAHKQGKEVLLIFNKTLFSIATSIILSQSSSIMADTLEGTKSDAITQFCIFLDNKVGRLNQVIRMLASINVHMMALATQDTTDCSIIRMVVEDPEKTRNHLHMNAFAFAEGEMTCVEIDERNSLIDILATVASADININYLYSFLYRPEGGRAIALQLEDHPLAKQALRQRGARVLTQKDLSR